LCAYSELLFYEHNYPELSGWWWAFRVEPFDPQGYIDSTVYDFDAFRPYVNAVYLRGAMFLKDIRDEIGDETFMAFLNGYAQNEAGKIATRQDFFSTLAHFSSADWTPLLAEYFKP
jgi:aminopeptidase N